MHAPESALLGLEVPGSAVHVVAVGPVIIQPNRQTIFDLGIRKLSILNHIFLIASMAYAVHMSNKPRIKMVLAIIGDSLCDKNKS